MKQIAIVFLLTNLLPVFGRAQDAREIVRLSDERARGKTSEAVLTVKVVRPSWTREMSMKTWSKGNELAMILITAPAKEKGTVFLKRKREVWNWIPSIERSIKLPPSMMGQSWMGTDFTNDDLVKEASVVEDYDHQLVGSEKLHERTCHKIQMIPKPDAAVVWGKVLLWIDQKEYLLLRAEYFDEDNLLVNTMTAGEIKMLGGKWLPSVMEMIPADKKGNKTILIYHSLRFDHAISDEFFKTERMQQLR